jgi:hypothetical protein
VPYQSRLVQDLQTGALKFSSRTMKNRNNQGVSENSPLAVSVPAAHNSRLQGWHISSFPPNFATEFASLPLRLSGIHSAHQKIEFWGWLGN